MVVSSATTGFPVRIASSTSSETLKMAEFVDSSLV